MPIKLKKIQEDEIPDWLFRSVIDDSLDVNNENNYISEQDVCVVFNRVVGAYGLCWAKMEF